MKNNTIKQQLEVIQKLTEAGEMDLEKAKDPIIRNVPSLIWINNFLWTAGSFYYPREKNRSPNDIDVIVRAEEDGDDYKIVLGADLRLKIDRILEKRTGLVSSHWHGEPHGPNWRAQPLYDLALIPHKPEEIIEINEPEFAREFYKEESDKKPKAPEKKFERFVKIIQKKKAERIVCGVVYEPDVVDLQGDKASAEEIKKACYKFMENVQRFGGEHVRSSITWAFGKKPVAKVLENYLAPVDFTMETQLVKKGSWVLITRVIDREIWQKIEAGIITGYSMAGRAKSKRG